MRWQMKIVMYGREMVNFKSSTAKPMQCSPNIFWANKYLALFSPINMQLYGSN